MAQPLIHSHQNLQTMYRQPSFAETKVLSTGKASIPHRHFTNSSYLSKGLNRSQSIKKSKPLTSENKNQLLTRSNCGLHKPTNEGKLYLRSQTCSSLTTSLTKTINKEFTNVNNDLRQSCNSKSITSFSAAYLEVENAGTRKEFVKKFDKVLPQRGVSIKKHSKPGTNKVNLSIVLSQDFPLNTENDYLSSDAEDNDEAGAIQVENGKTNEKTYNAKTCKTKDSTYISAETNRNLFPSRKVFYHSSRLNLISTNNTSSTVGASNILNAASLLTMRPPLLRATSAPVRCMHDSSNGTFLANKRKSRRRATNQVPEAKAEGSILITKVQKSNNNNKRMLTRAQSLTSEVITLVSLISPENSDSEKEDTSIIVGRRAPSLKKTGKSGKTMKNLENLYYNFLFSVSFQETNLNRFHLSSKECSHMLRRGSVASLAERLRANRPPTAPPVSIFFQHSDNSAEDSAVEVAVSLPNKSLIDSSSATKSLEMFTYPDHVRSQKGRECWKLFLKMSASGVNIAYDTIMRGLLTPTEFRQQQKQRELEEAKKFKENQANNQANNFSLQDNLKKK
uniref:Uncharacterized protein n=1 Tax=Glossina pallidipes TaxID=7398 RepID=A0A1A9ZG94_GLOPL